MRTTARANWCRPEQPRTGRWMVANVEFDAPHPRRQRPFSLARSTHRPGARPRRAFLRVKLRPGAHIIAQPFDREDVVIVADLDLEMIVVVSATGWFFRDGRSRRPTYRQADGLS